MSFPINQKIKFKTSGEIATIVADEGDVYKLDSGRIAKKKTRRTVWDFVEPTYYLYHISIRAGVTIPYDSYGGGIFVASNVEEARYIADGNMRGDETQIKDKYGPFYENDNGNSNHIWLNPEFTSSIIRIGKK